MAGEVPQIVNFQIEVAQGWIMESKRKDAHPRFQFVGYFMAFNALYWLWGMLDGVHKYELPRIEALVEKLGSGTAKRILSEHDPYIQFLLSREPIRRMDKRSRTSTLGDPGEGARCRTLLHDNTAPPTVKLKALASILYLIRCNLVHGSKLAHEQLPERSVPPLHSIAEACLDYTQRHRPK